MLRTWSPRLRVDPPAPALTRVSVAAQRHAAELVVVSASVVWFVYYAALALQGHDRYLTGRFDLGNMAQAVWNTAHGRFLEISLADGDQASRLAAHVDPILALFAPAAYVAPVTDVLLVAQVAALASGAWPVFRLAVHFLESRPIAVAVSLSYLLYPWMAWQTLNDFHAVALAIPLLLWAIWFLQGDRLWAFAVATVLALATGELVGLTLIGLAVWYASRRGRRRVALAIGVAGVAWTAACLWLVVPLAGDGSNAFYGRYETVGGSPGGMLETLVTDPGAIFGAMTSGDDIAYVWLLVVPLAGLLVWAPLALLGAVPQLLLNLLSDWEATTAPPTQYVSAIVPFLFLATILGLARLSTPRRRAIGAGVVLAMCFSSWVLFGPGVALVLRDVDTSASAARFDADREAVRRAVAMIPADAPVSATNRMAGHLSERRYVYNVPVVGRAAWIALDLRDGWIPELENSAEGHDRRRVRAFQQRLATDPGWEQVFARDGVFVYRRPA